MTSLQDQLFTRLNLKKRNDVTFEELPTILFSFAHTIPFENLDVIARIRIKSLWKTYERKF